MMAHELMEKKARWIALFLYGAVAAYGILSAGGQYHLLDIAADFVVYRPFKFWLYAASLLAVIVLPLLSERRLPGLFVVFIAAWLLSELVFKNGIEAYLKWPFSLVFLGKLAVVFATGSLLVASVARPLGRLPPTGAFLAALFGVFSSFLPNAVRLIGAASQ